MRTRTHVARAALNVSAEEAFAWHARPGALERLTPPFERVKVVASSGGIRDGGRVRLEVRVGPFSVGWTAVHRDFQEGRQFVDQQEAGPFARWVHTHRFHSRGSGASDLEDRVEYALPLGGLGDLLGRRVVEARLRRLFAYRHAVTASDLERHHAQEDRGPLRIAVSGATGLLGSALVPFLAAGGHQVLRLTRGGGGGRPDVIEWDPQRGQLDPERLRGLDAVIHLAGENIASGRWTEARRKRILESRVRGTRLLAQAIASLDRPPAVLLSASAVGFYGLRADDPRDESAPPGEGFLAAVCREWEQATEAAERKGVRVVRLRFGVVLTGAGGALARMLPPFRLGLGGPVGTGGQPMSWISREDAVGAAHFALIRDDLSGPVNIVAPESVTSAGFARTLGRVLTRPAVLPLPAPLVRGLFGRMGEELLLGGQRVVPARLAAAGFRWRHGALEEALRFELGRPG